MDHFLFSFNVVAPLFILMLVGYIARQVKFVTDNFLSEANKFVFRFSLPLMLFQNIQSSFHGDFSDIGLILPAVTGIGITIILSCLIVPLFIKKNTQRGSFIQAVYRSNFLIYGLPLATGMYGKEALAPISLLMGVSIPIYNIAAVIILSVFSEKDDRTFSFRHLLTDIVKNPLILGCVAGIILGLMNFSMPLFIEKPLNDFAGIATPLALFVMGGEFKFKSLKGNVRMVISGTLLRLVIVPFILLSVLIYFGFRNIELSILLCLFATPTAVSSYIMAENMGCDGELAGQLVVFTTIFSGITIFLFIFIFRLLGFL